MATGHKITLLHLNFATAGVVSDSQDVSFGIREITYSVPDSENLTISVNGVRIFCKGGNWGMDEAIREAHPARAAGRRRFACIRSPTTRSIRQQVGLSTSEDTPTNSAISTASCSGMNSSSLTPAIRAQSR